MHPSKFYINGQWVAPLAFRMADVINPATELPVAQVALGSAADVDRAVAAARAAFPAYSLTTKARRIDLLRRLRGRLPGQNSTARLDAPLA